MLHKQGAAIILDKICSEMGQIFCGAVTILECKAVPDIYSYIDMDGVELCSRSTVERG